MCIMTIKSLESLDILLTLFSFTKAAESHNSGNMSSFVMVASNGNSLMWGECRNEIGGSPVIKSFHFHFQPLIIKPKAVA